MAGHHRVQRGRVVGDHRGEAKIDSDKPGFVNPMRLVWELNEEIPGNAMVAADSGSSANWYARQLKVKGTMRSSLRGTSPPWGPASPT